MNVVVETTDRYGCPTFILFDPAEDEGWWKMEGELEGPFSTREDAERDLASR